MNEKEIEEFWDWVLNNNDNNILKTPENIKHPKITSIGNGVSIWSRILKKIGLQYRLIIIDRKTDMALIQRKILFIWHTIVKDISIDEAKIFINELESGIPLSMVMGDRKFIHYVQFIKVENAKREEMYKNKRLGYINKIAQLKKENNELKQENVNLRGEYQKLNDINQKIKIDLSKNPINAIEL